MRNRRWSAVLYRAQGKPGSPVDDLVRAPSLGGKPVHLLQGLPVQVLLVVVVVADDGGIGESHRERILQMAKCPFLAVEVQLSRPPIVHCKWQCGANGDQQQHAQDEFAPHLLHRQKKNEFRRLTRAPLTSTSKQGRVFLPHLLLASEYDGRHDQCPYGNQDDKTGDKIQLHCAVFFFDMGQHFLWGIFFLGSILKQNHNLS